MKKIVFFIFCFILLGCGPRKDETKRPAAKPSDETSIQSYDWDGEGGETANSGGSTSPPNTLPSSKTTTVRKEPKPSGPSVELLKREAWAIQLFASSDWQAIVALAESLPVDKRHLSGAVKQKEGYTVYILLLTPEGKFFGNRREAIGRKVGYRAQKWLKLRYKLKPLGKPDGPFPLKIDNSLKLLSI